MSSSLDEILNRMKSERRLQDVYAIDSSKGGVGKTTTTVCLAEALGLLGLRVLVIDWDLQANATYWIEGEAKPETTIASILIGGEGSKADPSALKSAIGKSTLKNVDLAYGNHLLADELAVAAKIYSERSTNPAMGLRRALGTLDLGDYDFVLIDCPPGAGVLRVMALTVADHVICPVNSQVLARSGLQQLRRAIDTLIVDEVIPISEIPRQHILMTMYSASDSLGSDLVNDILQREVERKELEAVINQERRSSGLEAFEQHVRLMSTRIRLSKPLQALPSHHKGIVAYSPRSNAVTDYAGLASEILGQYNV